MLEAAAASGGGSGRLPSPGGSPSGARVRLLGRRGAAGDGPPARPAPVPKGTLYGDREPRGGPAVATPSWTTPSARLAEAVLEGTVLDALASLRLTPRATEAIVARIEVSSAYPAADLDASVLAGDRSRLGAFDTFGVEGGNSRLAEALAAPLGAALLTGTPVEEIAWDPALGVRPGRRARALGGRRRGGAPGDRGGRAPLRPAAAASRPARSPRCVRDRRPSSTCRCSLRPSRARCSPCLRATGATPSSARTGVRRRSRLPSRELRVPSSDSASGPAREPGSRRSSRCGRSWSSTSARRCSPPGTTIRGRRAPTRRARARPARRGGAGAPGRPLAFAGEHTARRVARANGGRPAERRAGRRGCPPAVQRQGPRNTSAQIGVAFAPRGVQIGPKNPCDRPKVRYPATRSTDRRRHGSENRQEDPARVTRHDARAACWRMPAVDGGLTGSNRALGEGRALGCWRQRLSRRATQMGRLRRLGGDSNQRQQR